MRMFRVVSLMILVSACGSGGGGDGTPPTDPTGPTPPAPPAVPSQVSVQFRSDGDEYGAINHHFLPGGVQVARGGTVTWTNATTFVHNVTFTTAGAPANVPDMGSGSASRTFPSAGNFAYQCTLHEFMNGQVQVQ
jgi:plastocyanin